MLLYPEVLLEQKKDFILPVPSPEGINADIPLLIRAIRLSYDFNNRDDWALFPSELCGIVRPLLEGGFYSNELPCNGRGRSLAELRMCPEDPDPPAGSPGNRANPSIG